MLNSLLQDMGQRLAKKPFTWMSWWRGKRWIAVFLIIPPLSEACPLWKRDEASLRSLRLFGLKPKALHVELQHYWKKPFWQRWWLGLFTAIHDKRKVYAYYRRCLSFGKIQKQHPYTVSALKESAQEHVIGTELVNWFDGSMRHGEKTLEKHAGDLSWLQSRFLSVLSQYEQKREREFLKRMDKKLKKITTKEGRKSLQRRVKKEYQEFAKVAREYLVYPLLPEPTSAHNERATVSSAVDALTELGVLSDNQELVYLGPAAALATRATWRMCPKGKAHLGDMDSVGDWVLFRQEEIASLLEEGRPEVCLEIRSLLEQSLHSIRMLIEPQIEQYQQLIEKVREDDVEYQVAVEWSENLQRRLMKFFRSSVFLFHPDKSNGNEDLSRIQTEFFPQFRQLSNMACETLRAGLEILKDYDPRSDAEIQKILDEIERDRKIFRAELAKIRKEIAQMKKEREEYAQERKEIKAEIEELKQLMRAQNLEMNENPMLEETPGSSLDFFTRPSP